MRARICWTVGLVALAVAVGGPLARSEAPSTGVVKVATDASVYPMEKELAQAEALVGRRQFLDALAILREIIRQHDDHIPARFLGANALMQLRRYEAARVLLEPMLEKNPRHAGVLNNLAWLYATAEDPAFRKPDLAVELARRAILIRPDDYHIWSTLAEAYYAQREYARGARAAREALELATAQNAPASQRIHYEEQVRKCSEAIRAFSIIE